MRRLLKWFLMLNKRLYKKATFVIILCIVPVAAFSLSIIAKQDSGFVTIALAQEDNSDKISNEIIDGFLNDDTLIHFVKYGSAKEAYDAVKYGDADIAWIFPAGMKEKVNEFSETLSKEDTAVAVIERKDNVINRLTREKLSAALYKYTARAFYYNFARYIPQLDDVSDDEILQTYDEMNITDDLFALDSSKEGGSSSGGYLLAPVRGLLGVLILLCAMAAALFFMQDEKFGTFSFVPQNKLNFVAFACITIAVANVAAVVLVSLWAAGITTVIVKEILQILLYGLCCAAFGLLLKEAFDSARIYASVIPLIVIITTALCPVFFDFKKLLPLQLLFPPTYYINAVYDNFYLLYMPLYTAVCLTLTFVLRKFVRQKT